MKYPDHSWQISKPSGFIWAKGDIGNLEITVWEVPKDMKPPSGPRKEGQETVFHVRVGSMLMYRTAVEKHNGAFAQSTWGTFEEAADAALDAAVEVGMRINRTLVANHERQNKFAEDQEGASGGDKQ